MTVRLVTGLPGAGKSLRLVQIIREYLSQGRNVYVHGLDGLQAFGWEPCDPREWQSLPDGSVVVVDEAQKVWPTRRMGDPPADVRALSEPRHHGFDFFLATQHPTMLDSYVRKLVNGHEHVVRQWGSNVARLISWAECQDDPQALGTRQRGTDALWRHPRDCFDLYKSATQHTVKRKVPFRVWSLPVLLVVACVLAFFGVRTLSSFGQVAVPPVDVAGPVTEVATRGAALPSKPVTPEDYALRALPRLKSQPWSSALFDERKAQAEPELYCASMERGPCRCITEQGTRYELEERACRFIARNGQYNPFRKAFAPSSSTADSRVRQSDPGGRLKANSALEVGASASRSGARALNDYDPVVFARPQSR